MFWDAPKEASNELNIMRLIYQKLCFIEYRRNCERLFYASSLAWEISSSEVFGNYYNIFDPLNILYLILYNSIIIRTSIKLL